MEGKTGEVKVFLTDKEAEILKEKLTKMRGGSRNYCRPSRKKLRENAGK